MARASRAALLALALSAEVGQGLKALSEEVDQKNDWFGKNKKLSKEAVFALMTMPNPTTDNKAKQCQCLNWKEQYDQQHVRCGKGAELFAYTGGVNRQSAIVPFMRLQDQEFCLGPPQKSKAAFFPKQDHRYCVRINRMEGFVQNSGSWCYVSKDCEANNTFVVEDATIKAKKCVPGEDTALGDLMPSGVFALAQKIDTDLTQMVNMAYRPNAHPYDENLKLAAFQQTYPDAKGTFLFTSNKYKGVTKITWNDQLWHMFANNTKFPECQEGCDFKFNNFMR